MGKVIEIKPDYVQAMDKRAKIFSSQVFIYLFIHLLSDLLTRLTIWAKTFSSQGKFKEAQRDYEQVQQIKGISDTLSKNIQNLHIADSMRRQGSLV